MVTTGCSRVALLNNWWLNENFIFLYEQHFQMVHSSEVSNLDSSFEAVLRCVCYWHCLHRMWIVEQGLCSCWASVHLSCLHAASEILLLLPSSQEILIDYCRTSCQWSAAAMLQHCVQQQMWAVPRCSCQPRDAAEHRLVNNDHFSYMKCVATEISCSFMGSQTCTVCWWEMHLMA